MSRAVRDRLPTWVGARLDLPEALEEQAIAAFWEAGCLGVEALSASRSRARPRVRLEAWFPGALSRIRLGAKLARALRASGLPRSAVPRLRRLSDGRWVESWQRTLEPMPIGRRLLAVPERCPVPAGTRRLVLRIPFGQAFGTGEHASTRLSLRLLEQHMKPGARVADLGTGTGILAVAARRLGASRVLAIDADPIAVRVARETLRRNETRSIRLRCCDAGAVLGEGPFDLALVNIGAAVIARILPNLAASLAPGGLAILAGLLIDDERDLLEAGARAGFAPAGRLRSRPWSALVIRRAGHA